MQSKSITYKQYLLKKQKKKKQKTKNFKNDIILGYKFEHAKVNIKVCSLCMRVTEKKKQFRKKIYIIWVLATFIMKILTSVLR